jgi:hypothetical protein
MRPYLGEKKKKKPSHKKRAAGMVQGVGPEFKSQHSQKKQKT